MKYSFLNPLPNTQEIYRTKQAVLTCKVNSPRAPLIWYRGKTPIDPCVLFYYTRITNFSNDKRYIIEKDAVGRCTLTIKEVEQDDQAEWTAKVTDEVFSKVQVYVEEPRHTFVVPLKSQKINEKEEANLETDVNDKDADVEWWHDGVKIKVDGIKYKVEVQNRKRRLKISACNQVSPITLNPKNGISDRSRRVQVYDQRRQDYGSADCRAFEQVPNRIEGFGSRGEGRRPLDLPDQGHSNSWNILPQRNQDQFDARRKV